MVMRGKFVDILNYWWSYINTQLMSWINQQTFQFSGHFFINH